MASIEQEISAAMSEDDMAGDGSEDMQTSNYGTRSDPELDSDSDGELTATIQGEDDYYQDAELTPEPTFSNAEQTRMIHLRRYLEYLAEVVDEKSYVVDKTREELKKCREQMQLLEKERDETFLEIQTVDSEGNVSALNRLRAKHDRLCTELQNEQEVENKIGEVLEPAEYDLAQAQVEQGKYLLADAELQEKEASWERQREKAAVMRKQKEDSMVQNVEKKRLQKQRDQANAIKLQEQRRQKALEDAEKSHQKHSKYLQETVNKLRSRSAEESKREKEHIERRMKTMLSLKNDISANRENLKALQARDRALAKQQKERDEIFRNEIESAGGNPKEEMIKKIVYEDYERKKESFCADQRERQVEIAARLLEEEQRMKKRKQQQPYLFADPKIEAEKIVKPHRKPKLRTFEQYRAATEADMKKNPKPELVPERADVQSVEDEMSSPFGNEHIEDLIPDSDSEDEGNTNMAKPEFEGLWDKHKPYKVPKDEGGIRLPGATKMEKPSFQQETIDRIKETYSAKQKEIMERVLDKHKEGIVIKQVAGGKEFKGKAFYSKPDVIHFKDFDVGKSYKKKVTLTNVSYTVNHLKLLGMTEHLKDFIDIHFDPPGQMSAGLTCEMLVTFKPMINEDLFGEVNFLAQTGPLSVPIKCTTKKCDLSVDTSLVEFGTTVIGETLKRTFTLRNNGALGTTFNFYKITGLKQRSVTTADTSLGRLTTADTNLRGVSPDSEEVAEKNATLNKKKKDDKKTTKTDEKKEEEKPLDRPTDEEIEKNLESPRNGENVDDENDVDSGVDQDLDGTSSVLPMSEMDDLSSIDGMKVTGISTGEIDPFSTIKLEVTWQPTVPCRIDTDFVITFDDMLSENISIQAVANAIDVPVWVERQNVDLKICMYDRLYQDTIVVNNRATTALRLKFEVCKELRNHLELLPKTGYIQAQSTFSAQLKFLPRKSLATEAGQYFDAETGVLQAPMTIRVADQTRPVPFTVHAVVTTSDLEFDVHNIDFGHCTIYEAAKTTIHLTNKSILPQKFGFVGIPEYIDVQPNDGFGTLLPLETIEVDIIFKPSKAKDYNFELTCKSLINREFKLFCKGTGVHPPLELSKQVIHFASTTLNDVSTAALHVINSHTSMNEFTHPVPRIGKGEIAPVGPTSFEFVVPEGAPVTVSPSVATVMPGKKCRVQVRFTPTISDADIRKEAVRMLTKAAELRAKAEYEEALLREKENQEQAQKGQAVAKKPAGKAGKASPAPKGKGKQDAGTVSVKGPAPVQVLSEEEIKTETDEYAAAHASLLRQYKGNFQTVFIPCYVASGKCGDPGELPYSIHNTLYLEVHCPAVKPELVVISDNGRQVTDYGDVSIGQSVTKSITIQNISNKTIDLKSSVLDTAGPFLMLNAMRLLPPDVTHTLLICFTPNKGKIFQEVLDVDTGTSSLHITLKGKGVSPVVNLSVSENKMDMGTVIAAEYREDTFKIMNTSSLSIQYSIKLDSNSLLRHKKAQALPDFIKRNPKTKSLVGPQNYNGQCVFDCVPAEGVIPAGGSKEITVTFAPDHPSDRYSDGVRIELFGQDESHVFQLVGQAKPHIMYLTGGDDLMPDVESLAVVQHVDDEEDTKGLPIPILVTLRSVMKGSVFTTASREILVGCVRTMAVSQKKNGEWIFDNLSGITQLGFNIEPPKGMIEANAKKPVTITWTPTPGYDPNKPLEANINCTVKGDVVEVYKVMLRAMVISEDIPEENDAVQIK